MEHVLGRLINKTIKGVIQTPEDKEDGRVTLQFSDDSFMTIEAQGTSYDGEAELQFEYGDPLFEDEQAFAPTEAAPFLTGTRRVHPGKSLLDCTLVEGTREEVLDTLDPDADYVGGPTEAGNPVDDEIFEPVDEMELDLEENPDDETLDKMGR